ncbi:nucleoporin Nup133 family protein [Pleurotus pulmonarius]
MATFSSPAPRRSSRLRTLATSPPRRPWVASKPTSQRASPAPGPAPLAEYEDPDIMEVDEAASVVSERTLQRAPGETVYAKSEELLVAFYTHLPAEVKQILTSADYVHDFYTGDIDTLTGFALVASIQTCFVWQHAQAVKGTPTCYIFSCPQDEEPSGPPLHVLVPLVKTREPGLILISPLGEIRYWDSIGIGLAGGENYVTLHLDLAEDESVTTLTRADAQTFVVSTTLGHFYRLTLTSANGRHNLAWHVFAKPAPSLSLSRLIPFFNASTAVNQLAEPGNINAVALGAKHATGVQDIWALVDTRVQKWEMNPGGWEEPQVDIEVAPTVLSALRSEFGDAVEADDAKLDLELVDMAVDRNGKLAILVSYAGKEEFNAMAVDLLGVRRVYALVFMTQQIDSLVVDSIRIVPYQSTSASGAAMHARIQLISDGTLVTVQFGDVVAICARDSNYRDRLEFKAKSDRTLGVGVISEESTVLVLTATTMVRAYLDIDKIRAFDPETGRPGLVKSIMTQAILYGSLPGNPLHFSFPPEVEAESLMEGAEQLSQAILESNHELVQRSHDLSIQLKGRIDRLAWLIAFINENAMLLKMSQRSRQRLMMNAEKLQAGHDLWLLYNEILATSHSRSVLHDAVALYMQDVNEDHHADMMRAFFRLHIVDMGKLLRKVEVVVKRSQGPQAAALLPEATRIFLTVLKSAFKFREEHKGQYSLEWPIINPWTSKPTVIDVALSLFEAITGVVDVPGADGQYHQSHTEPGSLLPELATVLFACIQERLDWLGSTIANGEAGTERDRDELDHRFALLRPEILETIRRVGYPHPALSLAETYRDFSSLAALCHRDTVYPPHENPWITDIQRYIERFKDDFAFELFQWYIQHGELRIMFAQEDLYSIYFDRFFAAHPHPSIAWLHDLGKGRYESTAQTLLEEANRSTNLPSRQFLLSVGKLSELVHLQEQRLPADAGLLDAFHDGLDFVSVHEALISEFKSVLPTRGKQSLDSQVDTILQKRGTRLSSFPALSLLVKQFIRELLQGKALSMENVADVLSLQDNENSIENYITALQLLIQSEDLPGDRRLFAFRSIWRRIYIHDDWLQILQTANITDAEYTERLQQTALFATLAAISPQNKRPDPGLVLTPDAAAMTPTAAEISARWSGLSNDEIEALEHDYQAECERLSSYELTDAYTRVQELVQERVASESL